MLKWIKKKILEKKNKNSFDICKNCIWWNSEEMHNKPIKKSYHYCSINNKYTSSHDTCYSFKEELFEATKDSISTPELTINHELSIKKD